MIQLTDAYVELIWIKSQGENTMNEAKLIQDLEEINRNVDNSKKLPGAKNVYLAAGWFSDKQEELLKDAFIKLSANLTFTCRFCTNMAVSL